MWNTNAPTATNIKEGRGVDRHIAREHEAEHRRCQRCLVAAPKAAGGQAAVSSSQSKRRKVDDGAYFT